MSQTHFGFRPVEEGDKARHVRGVFDSVASRYDLMNDVLSFGLHRLWKSYTVAVADVRPGMKVLDIAGGTGDLALAFAKAAHIGEAEGSAGEVWLTDINERMLQHGRDRLLDKGVVLPTAVCDAEKLPFADAHFDVASVAFGLRNMTRKEAALAEMARVLKPGARLVITTPNDEDLAASTRLCPECGAIFHEWQHVRTWGAASLVAHVGRYPFRPLRVTPHDFFARNLARTAFNTLRRTVNGTAKPHLLGVFTRAQG
jgi:ubiquinone/menaquinone biosynthesis methyltransferase